MTCDYKTSDVLYIVRSWPNHLDCRVLDEVEALFDEVSAIEELRAVRDVTRLQFGFLDKGSDVAWVADVETVKRSDDDRTACFSDPSEHVRLAEELASKDS